MGKAAVAWEGSAPWPVCSIGSAAVTKLGAFPNAILARPDSSIDSNGAVVWRAKVTPGELNLTNPGTGSTPHLTAVSLRLRAGSQFVQIPNNSAALAVRSLVSGITALPPAHKQIKAGTLRALAVTGGRGGPICRR